MNSDVIKKAVYEGIMQNAGGAGMTYQQADWLQHIVMQRIDEVTPQFAVETLLKSNLPVWLENGLNARRLGFEYIKPMQNEPTQEVILVRELVSGLNGVENEVLYEGTDERKAVKYFIGEIGE
jgi:hypothetical protein